MCTLIGMTALRQYMCGCECVTLEISLKCSDTSAKLFFGTMWTTDSFNFLSWVRHPYLSYVCGACSLVLIWMHTMRCNLWCMKLHTLPLNYLRWEDAGRNEHCSLAPGSHKMGWPLCVYNDQSWTTAVAFWPNGWQCFTTSPAVGHYRLKSPTWLRSF